MRALVSAVFACSIIALLLIAGCADVNVQKKVGDFGTAFGTSSEEQKAIEWFTATYGDPRENNDGKTPPRFIEPLITTGIGANKMPTNKVTTFPEDGGSVYFFVIYDNFKKGDNIKVSWTYLENGREVTSVQQQAGGDFGRFIVEFQKPDSGWGKGTGKQRITVTGDGATASVVFAIGDTLQTTPLPYNPEGSTGTGLSRITPAGPKTSLGQEINDKTGNSRLPQGVSGGVTTTMTTTVTTVQKAGSTSQGSSRAADSLSASPKADVALVPGSIGIVCNSDSECDTGNCIDGVCCDHKCEGNCHYCAFPGHMGTCMDVPDWQDPRRACPMASGGTPECGASCVSGQCTFPDTGYPCGLCATCDGTGRCTVKPVDDIKCGVIECSKLSTMCRVYDDLKSARCDGLGSCKQINTVSCTQYTDLTCTPH
jgi:hypothetical protein